MNTEYRGNPPGTQLDYFDARAAVDAIAPGAYDRRVVCPTLTVLAENLVRRCDPASLEDAPAADRQAGAVSPWFPVIRVVCHVILGTALVDLASPCVMQSPKGW